MRMTTRIAAVLSAAALAGIAVTPAAGAAPGNGATVVSGQAFWVDGVAYRTVATPADLPSRAPTNSFDELYNFQGVQPSVAEAAPGQPGYNGGRWIVNLVTHADGWQDFADGASADGTPEFVSDEAVHAAIDAGALILTPDVRRFVCPVIPL